MCVGCERHDAELREMRYVTWQSGDNAEVRENKTGEGATTTYLHVYII